MYLSYPYFYVFRSYAFRVFAVITVTASLVSGSKAVATVGKLQIAAISSADYNGHPLNHGFVEDSDGFVYILNQTGVLETNSSWIDYLQTQEIGEPVDAVVDKQGRIWICGYRIFGYLSKQGSGKSWHYENLWSEFDELGIAGNMFLEITCINEQVFVSNITEVFCYRMSGECTKIGQFDYVRELHPFGDELFIGLFASDVYLWNGKEVYKLPNTLKLYGENVPLLSCSVDKNSIAILTKGGNFWLLNEDGLNQIPGLKMPHPEDLKSDDFEGLLTDLKHLGDLNFVVTSNRMGLWIIGKDSVRHIDRTNGLSSDACNGAFVTSQNVVWVAHNRGASYFRYPLDAVGFSEAQGIQGAVSDLLLVGNKLYILSLIAGYEISLDTFNFDTGKLEMKILPENGFRTGDQINGRPYLGTQNGFLRLEKDEWVRYHEGDCTLMVASKHFPGRLYFGGFNQLCYLEENARGDPKITKILSGSEVMHGLTEDDLGRVWLRKGLGSAAYVVPPHTEGGDWVERKFGPEDGLEDVWVNLLFVDGKTFATGVKAKVFDEKQQKFVDTQDFAYFGYEGPHSFRQKLVRSDGVDFVVTNDHIGEMLPRPEGRYHAALDFFGNQIDNRAISWEKWNDLLLLGYNDGLIVYRSSHKENLPEDQNLHARIDEVFSLDSKTSLFSDCLGIKNNEIELPSKLKNLRFEYSSNRMILKNRITYQTFLEGYEQESSEWSTDHQREFTNLPPGSYRFHLRVRDIELKQGNPAVFAFVIPTPWYLTIWAFLLYALALIGLAMGGLRLREAKLRNRNRWLSDLLNEHTKSIQDQADQLKINNAQLNEALTNAERLEKEARSASVAKSRFLATMSHEIRTPMNGVIGMCSLLEDSKLDDQQREFVHTIQKSGDYLLTLLNDILDYSKIEADRLELIERGFSLSHCVENVVALLSPLALEKQIELMLFIDPEMKTRRIGDVARLRQIFTNLLGNAIKFTDRGFVIVRMNRMETSDDTEEWIRVEFEDSGIGIPLEKQHHLFDPFKQIDDSDVRRHSGTGLGLSISQTLANRMGGDLFVFSIPGKGSIFGVEVPLKIDDQTQTPEKNYAMLQGKRALCVCAEDRWWKIINTYLTFFGVQVERVESPDALTNYSDDPIDLNIFIPEITLPTEEYLQQLQRLEPHISGGKLLISPYKMELSCSGICRVLWRPFSMDQLYDIIVQMLCEAGEKQVTADQTMVFNDTELIKKIGKVLLVEDNQVNQRVARIILERMGLKVDLAVDGLEAIKMVEESDYQLVLMDIQMPRMDGLAASRWIRQQLSPERQPRIIAMSAGVSPNERKEVSEAGLDGFIEKPVRPQRIYQELTTIVRG